MPNLDTKTVGKQANGFQSAGGSSGCVFLNGIIISLQTTAFLPKQLLKG